MLSIDVFLPGTIRLTLANQAEIWIDPTAEHTATPLPKLILATRGQAMEGIMAFSKALPQSCAVVCNSVLAASYPSLQATALGIGSILPVELGGLNSLITMVYAASDSVVGAGLSGGLACGYMIEAAGHKVYIAGHTGLCNELRFIGDFYKPNLAILPISNHQGIAVSQLPRVLGWVGADMIIPWPLAADIDVDELRDTVDAYTSGFCKVLKPGQQWELPEALSSGRKSGPESRY